MYHLNSITADISIVTKYYMIYLSRVILFVFKFIYLIVYHGDV